MITINNSNTTYHSHIDYVFCTEPTVIIDYLFQTIRRHLGNGERVLWLISGGSNIPIAVAVAEMLSNSPISNLYVSLIDERYGKIGHANENWQQLLDAGFKLPSATLYRPLTGRLRHETAVDFNNWLDNQLSKADYRIGLLGFGTDGHTSGIKPNSPAIQAEDWVTDYKSEDYERITTTFKALRHLDEAVTQAIDPAKSRIVDDLLHRDIPLNIQPVQVLKDIKKSTIYTDYKED